MAVSPAAEMTPHDCPEGMQLLHCLHSDDVDGAIEAGLMAFQPCLSCEPRLAEAIKAAQGKLALAWAARERYLARQARLARRSAQRTARHSAVPLVETKTALPPAAAEVLARAKAKAAQRGSP